MSERWYGIDAMAPRPLTAEEYQGHLDNIAKGEDGRMIFNCPHCGTSATVRTSRALSPLLREAYYQCRNLVCGHTFKVLVEAVETISPSSKPCPEIAVALDKKRSRDTPAAPPTVERQQQMAQLEYRARKDKARERAASCYGHPPGTAKP